jgi:CheY-like chemotaxis protein
MPGKNGLEVLHWIRENYSERAVAVYLLTSSEDPEHRRQASDDGATGYILKATGNEELIEKLDGLIELLNEKSGAGKECTLTT